MNDPTEPSALLLLGEIRGQLRELIHNANNNSQKLDALSLRVQTLEQDKSRREGALGFAEWMMRYGPILLGFVAVCVIVLVANGKL